MSGPDVDPPHFAIRACVDATVPRLEVTVIVLVTTFPALPLGLPRPLRFAPWPDGARAPLDVRVCGLGQGARARPPPSSRHGPAAAGAPLATVVAGPAPAAVAASSIEAVFLADVDDEDDDGPPVVVDQVGSPSNGAIEVDSPGSRPCGSPGEGPEALRSGVVEVFVATSGGGGTVAEAQAMGPPCSFPGDGGAECAFHDDTEFFRRPRDRTREDRQHPARDGRQHRWLAQFRHHQRGDPSAGRPRRPRDPHHPSSAAAGTGAGHGGDPTAVARPEGDTAPATGPVEGTKNDVTDLVGTKVHEHPEAIELYGHASTGRMWTMNDDVFRSPTPGPKLIVADGFDALRWTTVVVSKRHRNEACRAFREAGATIRVPTPEAERQSVGAA